MAEQSVMREFLIDLGYRVDAASEAKFKGSAGSASKSIKEFASTLEVAGTALSAMLAKSVSSMSNLSVASKRIGADVGNIKAFQFAIEQMGGSAEEAIGTLESMAQKFRESPGYYRAVEQLGVNTKDANGNLRDTVDIVADLGKKLSAMPMYQAKAYAESFGIDEKTLLAMRDPKFSAAMKEYSDLQKQMGVDQDEAAKSARELTAEMSKLYATLNIAFTGLAGSLSEGLVPAIKAMNEGLKDTAKWFGGLDPQLQTAIKTTSIVTAGFVALAGSLKAVSAAWNIAKGLGALAGGGAAAGGAATASGGAAAASSGFWGKLLGRFSFGAGLLLHSEGLNAGEDEWAARNRAQMMANKGKKLALADTPFGKLIARGEGDYSSVNRGQAGAYKAGTENLSGMTVAQVMAAQREGKFNAAGRYQIIGSTLKEAVKALGLTGSEKFDKATQDKIFEQYLAKNKRKALGDYLSGKSTNIMAAMRDVAMEWASVADPKTGKSFYAGVGNNRASISSAEMQRALEQTVLMNRASSGPQVSQTTTITVNGATDPVRTANAISDQQRQVNNDLARNFRVPAS